MIDLGSEEYETVLFVARECFVYRIPPRSSTAGYRAAEWGDMEAFLWKGRLRIIEKNSSSSAPQEESLKCFIRLEDGNSGELFALCPYTISGQSVESVLDSSRYFVLRVENESSEEGGKTKKAFIGMGFQDRSESFDFNVALQDWTKRAKAAKAAKETPKDNNGNNINSTDDLIGSTDEPSPHVPSGPKQDYSLKEGQTFSIKIPGSHAGRKIRDQQSSSTSSGFGGGGPLLPPPPSKRG